MGFLFFPAHLIGHISSVLIFPRYSDGEHSFIDLNVRLNALIEENPELIAISVTLSPVVLSNSSAFEIRF